MPELAVIIVVALVVLGPKRLPEVARSLGKGLAEFRRLTGDVNKELDAARHMIESEARDHENERRRAEREARATSEQAAPGPALPDDSEKPTSRPAAETVPDPASGSHADKQASGRPITDKETEG